MNRQDVALLLYLETCAVDHGGLIDARKMNEGDFVLAENWVSAGFLVGFGRVASECIKGHRTRWVNLSDRAWFEAHRQRRQRHQRIWERRPWYTTEEKRTDQ